MRLILLKGEIRLTDAIFKGFYLAGLIAAFVIRYPAARRRKQERIKETRQSGRERLLLALTSLGLPLLPMVYLLTPWFNFADYSLPVWSGQAGMAVFSLGIWLLWRSQVDLGRNWSSTLEVREEHFLVTDGVYKHIRHPMYAAHWLLGLGQVLLLQNWIAGWSMLATFIPLYLTRVKLEEQMMLDNFGEAYRSYMSRTGRIIPKFL